MKALLNIENDLSEQLNMTEREDPCKNVSEKDVKNTLSCIKVERLQP